MQFIVISEQLASVLWSLLLGCFFAVCYDALRVVRMLLVGQGIRKWRILGKVPTVTLHHGSMGDHLQMLFTNISDVLYSIFAAASFCIFLYHVNSGRFRWYLLFACAIGFILYRLSLGRLANAALGYITGAIRVLIGFILYVITRPASLFLRGVRIIAKPVKNKLRRNKMLRETEKIRKSLHDAVRFQ